MNSVHDDLNNVNMANVDVIEDVAKSSVKPVSPDEIDEKTKRLAEEIKEKANVCFKSMKSSYNAFPRTSEVSCS
jgi:hypothetical protein